MANLFVRSTDGSDADNGTTWALAKATLSGAAAIDAAGDTIYVSDNHSESSGSTQTIALAGTYASPTRVLCVDDAGDPSSPTALATSAVVATTTSFGITVSGVGYIYGHTFQAGSGGSSSNLTLAATDGNFLQFDSCKLICNGSGTGSRINFGSATSNVESRVHLRNTDVKFTATGHGIVPAQCKLIWEGGSLLAGGTSPTALILPAGNQIDVLVSGVDLSAAGAGMNLVAATASGAGTVVFRNCKLPASWTGFPAAYTSANVRVEMWNCDSGDTNYGMWINDYFGNITHEAVITRTGAAGNPLISWKMVSAADAEYPIMVLRSPEMAIRNAVTGSAVTVTVEIIHDSLTDLNDDEAWLEVLYMGTAGVPLGTWVADSKATVLSSAAAQTASTVTWTTTGITNVRKQKLAVTFTPQKAGVIHARVALAKASYTIYVDPTPVVS